MKVHVLALWLMAVTLTFGAAIMVVLRDDGRSQSFGSTGEMRTSLEKVEPVVVKEPIVVKRIEKLEIDLNERRVHIPREGWISAQAFWDIYYNEPQKLPGKIDFDMLLRLEALTQSEHELAQGIVEPPQLPAILVDDPLDPAFSPSSQ